VAAGSGGGVLLLVVGVVCCGRELVAGDLPPSIGSGATVIAAPDVAAGVLMPVGVPLVPAARSSPEQATTANIMPRPTSAAVALRTSPTDIVTPSLTPDGRPPPDSVMVYRMAPTVVRDPRACSTVPHLDNKTDQSAISFRNDTDM
jgi:hypothetical protein